MIPVMNIVAWGNVAPWVERRQIEQDLIISRAIVELFADEFLREELRFRGGTALNKLHFPKPLRYSEDIDLVRTTTGPIGPVLDRVRAILEPWLGRAGFDQSPVAPKLIFRVPAEGRGAAPLRLKLEINTRETEVHDEPRSIRYSVDNPWFAGAADISTYSSEEMLATKLRALLQRNKGRDLIDLSHSLAVIAGLDTPRVVDIFARYLERQELVISRAQAEERMFAKLSHRTFDDDIRPLLAQSEADLLTDETVKIAFECVFASFITAIPGDPWARTAEMSEKYGIEPRRHT